MKNIINNIKKGFLLLSSVLFLFSCQKEHAVAPPLTFDGKATWTIREMLDNDFSANLPDSIISGIVVSSDEQGNFYKTIVIQDETGGIQIKIDNSTLYNRYKIGQRVFVKCKDLVLGRYYGLAQLGFGDDIDNVIAIPSKFEFDCIFRHQVPVPEPAPYVISSATTTEDDLLEHLNMLIEIPNCEFAIKDVPFVDPNSSRAYTSRDLNVKIGNRTLTVNTSRYVDDAIGKTLTPTGTGTVRGILTVYKPTNSNPTYQIVLRSIKDIDFVWEKEYYNLEDHVSEDKYGWAFKNSGAAWFTQSINNKPSFCIDGTDEESNSWLISPSFNLSAYNSADLRFDRFYLNGEDIQLYYTTSNYTSGDAIIQSNWTEIELPAYESTNWETKTVAIPTSAKHIAFRYTGSTSKNYLRGIIINVKESN